MIFKRHSLISLLLLTILITPANSAKWWDVYFSPGYSTMNSELELAMSSFIATASQSVYVSSFTWGTSSHNQVVNACNTAFSAGKDVKLVGDGSNAFSPEFLSSIPRNDDGSNGDETHNKLIIIDAGTSNAAVATGSTNWTEGGYATQYNNSVILYVPSIADEYATEFNELYGGTFHGGSAGNSNFTAPDGSPIELYFSPENDPVRTKMLPAIQSAQKSVLMFANNITKFSYGGSSDAVGDALIAAKSSGAIVEIVFDQGYYESKYGSASDVIDRVVAYGIDARMLPGYFSHQHNKTVVIDGELVITGSANFTKGASIYNDENQIYIWDPVLAREYLQFFHTLMSQATVMSSNPTYEQNAPSAITEVTGTALSTGIQLSWSPSSASDFDRYHIYVETSKITDVSGLRPEISTLTTKTTSSYLVNTINDNDSFVSGTTYYFAVTAADKHGNESIISNGSSNTNGIVYTGIITGALPSGTLEFASGASDLAASQSQLKITVSNDSIAVANIVHIRFDFRANGNIFNVSTSQTNPSGWTYTVSSNNRYVDAAAGAGSYIGPGETSVFYINVTNPASTGQSEEVLMETTDNNGAKISGISIGSLTIQNAGVMVTGSSSFASGADKKAGEYSTVEVTANNSSSASAKVTKMTIVFGSSNNSFSPRSSSYQTPPTGWTVTSVSSSQIIYSPTNSSNYISAGQNVIYSVAVTNPIKSGLSDEITLTVEDDQSPTQTTSGISADSHLIYASDEIIINEIMPYPPNDNTNLEYIELYNRNTHSSIDVSNWNIQVGSDSLTLPSNAQLSSDGFLTVINNDSDFVAAYGNVSNRTTLSFAMDNSADNITITSSDGSYNITLRYDVSVASWGSGASGTGSSFEKISPSVNDVGIAATDGQNWQQSAVGGTPGAPNSSGPVSLSNIQVSDGTNTITDFSSIYSLLDRDITITITLSKSTSNAVYLWWDSQNNPDGSGGSTTDSKITMDYTYDGNPLTYRAVISGSNSEITNGNTVKFFIITGGSTFNNSDNFYAFTIDSSSPVVYDLIVSSYTSTSVSLSWTALTNVTDFNSYKIYYSQSSITDTTASGVTSAVVPGITNSSTTISGLIPTMTYYFNIVSLDNIGNESIFKPSFEVSATLKPGYTVSNVSVFDGIHTFTSLDGTEYARYNNVTVNFYLDKDITDASSLSIYYDVGADPDGAATTNSEDRKRPCFGGSNVWYASIPFTDAEIVNGSLVRFIISINDDAYTNNGSPWKYNVVDGAIPVVSGATVADTTGKSIRLTWGQISSEVANFSHYKVYYTSSDTLYQSSSQWGPANDPNLSYRITTFTSITGLSPNSTYKFKIVGVDSYGNESNFDQSTLLTATTSFRGTLLITEVCPGTDGWVELYCLQGPVDISNFIITDLNGMPDGSIATSSVTLQTGDYAVYTDSDLPDETDLTGDSNSNGHFDIYDNNTDVTFPLTRKQVVLLDPDNDTVDVFVYHEHAKDSLDAGAAALTSNEWSGEAVCTHNNENGSLNSPLYFARRKQYNNYLDTNKANDWKTQTVSSKGKNNTYSEISSLKIGNGSDTKTLTLWSNLRLNNTYTSFEAVFNYLPVRDDKVVIFYDTNTTPGTSNVFYLDDIIKPSQKKYTGTGFPTGFADGSRINLIVSQLGQDTPGQSAENTNFYSYENTKSIWSFIYDKTYPETVTQVSATYSTKDKILLVWKSLNTISDFKEYRVFYSTNPDVDFNSNSWTSSDAPELANNNSGYTYIKNLASSTTYYFAVAAYDNADNATLSDTTAYATKSVITADNVSLSNDTNNYTNVNSSVTFSPSEIYVTAIFNRILSSAPDIYYDTGATSYNITMTKIADRRYGGTIPLQPAGNTVNLVFKVNADTIYRYSNYPWRYTVDATPPPDITYLSFAGLEYDYRTVAIVWSSISNLTDFSQYKVYYQLGTTIDKSTASVWTSVDDPNLAIINTVYSVVRNLTDNETYTFSVAAADNYGNESDFADTILIKTNNAQPATDPAYDGINTAFKLDGSEFLIDTDITIHFEFTSEPLNPESVFLFYAIEQNPTADFNSNYTRHLKMSRVANTLIWECVIPSSDSEIVDGVQIRYLVLSDGSRVFNNKNQFYKFRIDGSPPAQITYRKIFADYGDRVGIQFSKIAPDNSFKEYRIYYNTEYPAVNGSFWNSSDDPNLANINTIYTYVKNLNPNENYYFNVAAIDAANQISPLSPDLLLTRTSIGQPSQLIKLSNDVYMPMPFSNYELSAQVLDNNNKPVKDVAVRFTKISGNGSFANTPDTFIDILSNIGGISNVEYNMEENIFNMNKITASVSGVDNTLIYIIQALNNVNLTPQTENQAVYPDDSLNYTVILSDENNVALKNMTVTFEISYINQPPLTVIQKQTNNLGIASINLDFNDYETDKTLIIHSYLQANKSVSHKSLFLIIEKPVINNNSTSTENIKDKIYIGFAKTKK